MALQGGSGSSGMGGMGGSMPSPEQMAAQELMESCPAKTVISGVIGFGMGGVFGMLMSSFNTESNEEIMKLRLREQMRRIGREMWTRSYASAKNLSVVGAAFAGSECIIETYRAKNDIYNGVAAGCVTGGALAARAGPHAVVAGCVGFAAFSAAIDYVMKEVMH